MTFEQFVKQIGNRYQQYVWSFSMEDGVFIAECDQGIVAHDPNTGQWVIGIRL